MRGFAVVLAAGLLGGCVGHGHWGEHARFPDGQGFLQAAKTAATAKQTWVPMASAAVLVVADVDDKWSEDLWEDQPLFGHDADDISDDLRNIASGAYILTALLAPSPTVGAKVRGLAVGAATAIADGVVNRGLKDLIQRERLDGSNDNGMPSGHASKAASRTAMARYNLQHMEMPQWSRRAADWTLHGVAVGTGLARVEAGKHHLSDVLVGYGLGNFMASFFNEAFLSGDGRGAQISFAAVEEGGAFTVVVPLD